MSFSGCEGSLVALCFWMLHALPSSRPDTSPTPGALAGIAHSFSPVYFSDLL